MSKTKSRNNAKYMCKYCFKESGQEVESDSCYVHCSADKEGKHHLDSNYATVVYSTERKEELLLDVLCASCKQTGSLTITNSQVLWG